MINKIASLRSKIAREAATLLYLGIEKEYKQAKLKAVETLGAHFLPTNLEVALELDRLADETEGTARRERLAKMRKTALEVMSILGNYHPVLVGSVWRGTIRCGSDIDLAVYHDSPSEIVSLLKASGLIISRVEKNTVTKKGKVESSVHIYVEIAGHNVEIVVRSPEEKSKRKICEIFGDEIKGLNLRELEALLKENPHRKFIPV
ncbi:MAG: nucleotidyltransferase domain-containing protein [Candidatus Bathyarchaeia archaeon]